MELKEHLVHIQSACYSVGFVLVPNFMTKDRIYRCLKTKKMNVFPNSHEPVWRDFVYLSIKH